MHVVIWTSKGQRYATPSSSVVEVIPMVQSRPIAESQDWLKGVFEFRGMLLPLIDSSRWLGHEASVLRMSSRILVVHTSQEPTKDRELVGLIVESVLACENLDFEQQAFNPTATELQSGFLGPLTRTPHGTVQLTFPTRLANAGNKASSASDAASGAGNKACNN